MTLKQECPDPEGEWHDHGACVTEELMVRAHECETLGWDDKLSIIFAHLRSLRYWTHDLATSLINTPTGDFLDQLSAQSDEALVAVLELKKRGRLSKIFAEEHEKQWKWERSPLHNVFPGHIEP